MNLADAPVRAQRVLLLLGTARDTQLAGELLARSGIASHACPSASQLRLDIEAGVGAVLIAEEALDAGGHDALLRTLEAQPAWSDLPILVLARPGADSTTVGEAIAALGNVTLLERPLRVAALVSVVRTALRARARQYQIEANMKSLEQARDAEAMAARRKDEFLAMLAHELRNPLAPIRSALFLLGQDDGEDEGRRQLRQLMERQVDHLVRLVDDLLESSRLSRGKIELQREPIDLKDPLLRAVELSRPQIEAAGCALELDLDPAPLPLVADPIRIAQVFGNLLNNAARYGRSGGRIRLEARRTRAGEVRVRVVDDGIGIDAETLPHVFELFTQGTQDADHSRGGLGIGLALVRALVEQHGGRVAAASAGRGCGAEFSVWLPLAARARQAVATPQAVDPAPATAGLRVLVVDDNRDAARTLALVLGTLGIEHVFVHDGASALAAADALSPDAVLLDLGMPGMDGYEVARRLRADPRHAHTLLVALTGWSGAHDQVRSREAGFDHHLRKPADVNTLVRLLAAVAPAHAGAPCAGSPPPPSTPLTVR